MPNSDYKDIKIIVDHRKNGATICWKNYYINGQRGGFKKDSLEFYLNGDIIVLNDT